MINSSRGLLPSSRNKVQPDSIELEMQSVQSKTSLSSLCPICQQNIRKTEMAHLECIHRICKNCLPMFVKDFVKDNEKRMADFYCPFERNQISVQSLRAFLSRTELYALFKKEQVEKNGGRTPLFCLTKECPSVITNNKLRCPNCF